MKEQRIALKNMDKINPKDIDEYISVGGYEALKKTLTMSSAKIIKIIEDSGLRGRGGAGFPTGMKWKYTAATSAATKYVICNSDEGEPGTSKDRPIMENDPHLYLEGLMIAGKAVGAEKGYVYIRGEYYQAIELTQIAIAQARKKGFLGENILGSGFSFDLEVKLGAGSYLCGEESALIESLEGKRGYPRIKPPYPAEKGVFQKPTLMNNVETLAHIPDIVLNGADWYKSFGTKKSPGTKIYTISGMVNAPGYYEAELGISLRDLIYGFGGGIKNGKKIKTALLGGAAGTFISSDYLDIPMDYESLKTEGFTLGSGAVIVLSEGDSLVDILRDILRFFHHESCGKCVPCRVGTKQILMLIDQFKSDDRTCNISCVDRLLEVTELMAKTSLCPLGQSPVLPVKSAITHFREDFLEYKELNR